MDRVDADDADIDDVDDEEAEVIVEFALGPGLPGAIAEADVEVGANEITQADRVIAVLGAADEGRTVLVRAARASWWIAQTDGRRAQLVISDAAGVELARFHPQWLLAGGLVEAGAATLRLRRNPLTNRWRLRGGGIDARFAAAVGYRKAARVAASSDADRALVLPLLVLVAWVMEDTRQNTPLAPVNGGG